MYIHHKNTYKGLKMSLLKIQVNFDCSCSCHQNMYCPDGCLRKLKQLEKLDSVLRMLGQNCSIVDYKSLR